MTNPKAQIHYVMTLDGKEFSVTGAYFPQGMKATGTAKRVDANTILENRMANGTKLGVAEYKVSPDGKTLTVTMDGPKTHEKSVYDRQ